MFLKKVFLKWTFLFLKKVFLENKKHEIYKKKSLKTQHFLSTLPVG